MGKEKDESETSSRAMKTALYENGASGTRRSSLESRLLAKRDVELLAK